MAKREDLLEWYHNKPLDITRRLELSEKLLDKSTPETEEEDYLRFTHELIKAKRSLPTPKGGWSVFEKRITSLEWGDLRKSKDLLKIRGVLRAYHSNEMNPSVRLTRAIGLFIADYNLWARGPRSISVLQGCGKSLERMITEYCDLEAHHPTSIKKMHYEYIALFPKMKGPEMDVLIPFFKVRFTSMRTKNKITRHIASLSANLPWAGRLLQNLNIYMYVQHAMDARSGDFRGFNGINLEA